MNNDILFEINVDFFETGNDEFFFRRFTQTTKA